MDDKLLETESRVLNAPKVFYGAQQPKLIGGTYAGTWNLQGGKFTETRSADRLIVLFIDRDDKLLGQVRARCTKLAAVLKDYGFRYRNPPDVRGIDLDCLGQELRNCSSTDSLLVVLSDANTSADNFARVKCLGDSLGHPTVCITNEKLAKQVPLNGAASGNYVANIASKLNLHLGGTNQHIRTIHDEAMSNKYASTMIVGADVTHLGSGSVFGCPSIAGIVASMDDQFTRYSSSIRLQTSKQEVSVFDIDRVRLADCL